MKLIAHFKVKLPGHCLVTWPDEDEISFSFAIGEFDVEIQLVSDWPAGIKNSGDKNWTCMLNHALVQVSREEEEAPTVIIPDEKRRHNYSQQSEYFAERIKDYGPVASEAINRLILFLKYTLKTPYLTKLPKGHENFQNAAWIDGSGNDYGHGGTVYGSVTAPRMPGKLGEQALVPELKESLQAALRDPIVPSLYEEILSDAQTALFEGNIRRAVLEMAIACEILVKRKYFSEESLAGAAFDYLEDKSKVNARFLDFVDRIALAAIGKSFRVDQREHYKNIDHLFRCRNKIAHRGILSYRDDTGTTIQVEREIVLDWWDSVWALIEWLAV